MSTKLSMWTAPWAILPEVLQELQRRWMSVASASEPDVLEISADESSAAAPARVEIARKNLRGSVQVIPVSGVLTPKTSFFSMFFGGTGLDMLTMQLREAMADTSVSAVVLDIDSPGGSVYGMDEFSQEVFEARSRKPIVAIASPLAASAAYNLAVSATELMATPSGEVGSIGVYMAHMDWSRNLDQMGVTPTLISAGKYKVEGNPYQPLTEEARDAFQASVNRYYDMFVKRVAKGRNVSVSQVRSGFGEGRVLGSQEALSLGMIDRVGTLDDAISRAATLTRRPMVAVAVDTTPLREAVDVAVESLEGLVAAEATVQVLIDGKAVAEAIAAGVMAAPEPMAVPEEDEADWIAAAIAANEVL